MLSLPSSTIHHYKNLFYLLWFPMPSHIYHQTHLLYSPVCIPIFPSPLLLHLVHNSTTFHSILLPDSLISSNLLLYILVFTIISISNLVHHSLHQPLTAPSISLSYPNTLLWKHPFYSFPWSTVRILSYSHLSFLLESLLLHPITIFLLSLYSKTPVFVPLSYSSLSTPGTKAPRSTFHFPNTSS